MRSKRFIVLGGPRGYLTCVAPSNRALLERYAGWQRLFTVHRPLTVRTAQHAKAAALRTYVIA